MLKQWRFSGEQLTAWMDVQQILSVVLVCSNTEEQRTNWIYVQFCQWFWSTQTLESDLHTSSVSQSRQWFWSAQALESYPQAVWCSADFINGSEMLKRLTVCMGIQSISSVFLIFSIEEQLTSSMISWMGVQTESDNLVSDSDLLKNWRENSQPGWVFSQSCQWFWYAQLLESYSPSEWVFSQSC